MGIRIHKVLGWGISDLKYNTEDPFQIIDERINVDIFKEAMKEKVNDIGGFIEWVKINKEECINVLQHIENRQEERKESSDISITLFLSAFDRDWNTHINKDPLTYDPEYGSPSVLLFSPVEQSKWARCDDNMDYYEWGSASIDEPLVLDLSDRSGLYPWTGNFYHIPHAPHFSPTCKYTHGPFPVTIPGGDFNKLVGRWDGKTEPILKKSTVNYFLKWYRPTIGSSVAVYCKWLNIFNDFEKHIHSLKPILYTYWS